MKNFWIALLAVWIIKYDVITGSGQMPCVNTQPIQIGQDEFQQPLCIGFKVIHKEWPTRYKSKKEATALAEYIKQQGGAQNVRVEESK